MSQQWLDWAKKIQSISQSGLAFSKDAYDLERYEELQKLSAEIIVEHTNVEMEKVMALFANEKGYQTPKVDVRGALFYENQILLVREKIDDKWSLPGGFCDVGLSPVENIVKEIKEESGYDARAQKLVALLDMNKHSHPPQPYHYYKIFIQCELTGGQAETGLETKDVKFFSEDCLPELSEDRNTKAQIHMLFEFLYDVNKVALFD